MGRALLCLLCVMVGLGGCASREEAPAQPTLPPPEEAAMIPLNDTQQGSEQTVLLYLPSVDGTALAAVPATASLSVSRHNAEALCRLLFAAQGNEYALALPGDVQLSGTQPVEISGDVATVSLAASALRLSHEELFTVCQAITNTLCQFGDVQYVNVLINGVQPGMDVAATLPAGCFRENTKDDLSTLWNREASAKTASRHTWPVALYYPSAGARGIVCEARSLSFDSLETEDMLLTLLKALHVGPVALPELPSYPDLEAYLLQTPRVLDVNGSRRAVLYFDTALNTAIIENGITRSVMAASLVYTITTFMPGVEGVEIHIGEEMVSSLTPSATYTGAGETIHFDNNLMRRGDFSAFLLDGCTLYFADGNGKLREVTRMVPFYESRNVRSIFNQLIRGTQPYDSVEKLQPVLPEGLRDADLIGVAFSDDTLILNFSQHWAELCREMDEQAEKQMIYAMVNALCRLQGVKRVQFLVNGTQPETLAGYMYIPGSFLPHLDLVVQ